MEMLFTIAVWAGLFYVMMRLGSDAHIIGRGHRNGQNAQANIYTPGFRHVPAEKDTDPVCKRTIATSTAKTSVYAGKVYYFCSRDCREIFEAAPDLYVGAGDTNHKRMEHSHV